MVGEVLSGDTFDTVLWGLQPGHSDQCLVYRQVGQVDICLGVVHNFTTVVLLDLVGRQAIVGDHGVLANLEPVRGRGDGLQQRGTTGTGSAQHHKQLTGLQQPVHGL